MLRHPAYAEGRYLTALLYEFCQTWREERPQVPPSTDWHGSDTGECERVIRRRTECCERSARTLTRSQTAREGGDCEQLQYERPSHGPPVNHFFHVPRSRLSPASSYPYRRPPPSAQREAELQCECSRYGVTARTAIGHLRPNGVRLTSSQPSCRVRGVDVLCHGSSGGCLALLLPSAALRPLNR